ncbi:DUF4410 domain-containing protein [Trinickia dinghuensis]|uniref:DUF4410 domain-containing protein n=1 Tax=Trinickia dinghuensis TaxID=2291023 RepID=UPI0015F18F02|nr:DUF4410 domain-containing protein [Trinickia dinghuensis]
MKKIGMVGANVALALGVVVMTGCASPMTSATQNPAVARATPEIVYVRAFDVSPDQCERNDRYVQQQVPGAMPMPGAAVPNCATRLREDVANEIVRQLQAKGWVAMRAEFDEPPSKNALLVEGSFGKVDAGNARRRVLVGLGAGKRELEASVTLTYRPVAGANVPVQNFAAKEQSGKAPGMAESGAVGALTHRLPVALVAGAALHVVSEAKHSSVDTDAKKLATSIVKQVDAVGVANNWGPHGQSRVVGG